MRKIEFNAAVCACLSFLALSGGCHKNIASTPSGANIEAAFKGTKPEVREFADQAVAAEEKSDFNTAFVHYRALSLNADLTTEQRNLANNSMIAMNKKLREAVTNGDTSAAAVLKMYNATK